MTEMLVPSMVTVMPPPPPPPLVLKSEALVPPATVPSIAPVVAVGFAVVPATEGDVGELALPQAATFESWRAAWSTVCTGVSCEGIRGGFANSLLIALPSTAIAIGLGALNGYALAFWRVRGAQLLFALLMLGAFVPLQVMIYPLVRVTAMLRGLPPQRCYLSCWPGAEPPRNRRDPSGSTKLRPTALFVPSFAW